jgi:hypothetical protein
MVSRMSGSSQHVRPTEAFPFRVALQSFEVVGASRTTSSPGPRLKLPRGGTLSSLEPPKLPPQGGDAHRWHVLL